MDELIRRLDCVNIAVFDFSNIPLRQGLAREEDEGHQGQTGAQK